MSRFLRRLRRSKGSLRNEAWRARTAWKMEAWRGVRNSFGLRTRTGTRRSLD
jgi:hypothetical protein